MTPEEREHLGYLLDNLQAASKALDDALIEYRVLVHEEPTADDHRLHDKFVGFCRELLGVPYAWGGNGPDTVDCSGLVVYGLRKLGLVNANWDATSETMANWPEVQVVWNGDILVFSLTSLYDHVGVRTSYREMIQAPQPGDVVKMTNIDNDWWMSRLDKVVCPFGGGH